MVSSDNVLSCFLDFNFLVNSELNIGDVNSDGGDKFIRYFYNIKINIDLQLSFKL